MRSQSVPYVWGTVVILVLICLGFIKNEMSTTAELRSVISNLKSEMQESQSLHATEAESQIELKNKKIAVLSSRVRSLEKEVRAAGSHEYHSVAEQLEPKFSPQSVSTKVSTQVFSYSRAFERGLAYLECRQTPRCDDPVYKNESSSLANLSVTKGVMQKLMIAAITEHSLSPENADLLIKAADNLDFLLAENSNPKWMNEVAIPPAELWKRRIDRIERDSKDHLRKRGLAVRKIFKGFCGSIDYRQGWNSGFSELPTMCAKVVLDLDSSLCNHGYFHFRQNGRCGCVLPKKNCSDDKERTNVWSEEVDTYELYQVNASAPVDRQDSLSGGKTILPSNVKGIAVPMYRGGGFGSIFQFAAFLFNRTLFLNPGAYGDLNNHFRWYTGNNGCYALGFKNRGYRCFFQSPLSGRCSNVQLNCNQFDPGESWRGKYFDSNWWWNTIQAYMFRPNTRLMQSVYDTWDGKRSAWKPELLPDITAHLRFGDKLKDGESLQKARDLTKSTSPESFLDITLKWATQAYAACGKQRKIRVYLATDSLSASDLIARWAQNHSDILIVHYQSNSSSQRLSHDRQSTARLGKYLYDKQYQLAKEVLVDITLMSKATVFIGRIMSQLGRIAVSVGKARGRIQHAVAMDEDNIGYRDNNFGKNNPRTKFGFEEGWLGRDDDPLERIRWSCD